MVEIKAMLIFEMLGRPVEHLKATLEGFVGKVAQEKGVEILNKKIREPKKIEEVQQEIYTAFAETEIKFDGIDTLLRIVFVYMPSHIEIISPSEFQVKNFEIGTLMSEIARKLHQYDEIAKRLAVERNILMRQLQEIGVRPAILPPETEEEAKERKKAGEKIEKAEKKVEKSKKKTEKKKSKKKAGKNKKKKKS